MVSRQTVHKIAIVAGTLSLVLQTVGFSCPGWIVVDIDLSIVGSLTGSAVLGLGEIVSHMSVWYTKICVVGEDHDTCSHDWLHDSRDSGLHLTSTLFDLRNFDWTEVQIELTLAIVFCVTSLVLAIVGLCYNAGTYSKVLTSLASANMFVSWVLILPAVIKVGLLIQDTETAIEIYERNNGPSYIDVRTPWALALSTTGLILALFSCVLLLVCSCKQNEKTSGLITPESSRSTPAEMQNGTTYDYPVAITKIFVRDGTLPHLPPQYNTDMLPSIGSKDTAPLECPDFGLTPINRHKDSKDDGSLVCDTEILPPSTPPLDTALRPSIDITKQDLKNTDGTDKDCGRDISTPENKQAIPENGEHYQTTGIGSQEVNTGHAESGNCENAATEKHPFLPISDSNESKDGRENDLRDKAKHMATGRTNDAGQQSGLQNSPKAAARIVRARNKTEYKSNVATKTKFNKRPKRGQNIRNGLEFV